VRKEFRTVDFNVRRSLLAASGATLLIAASSLKAATQNTAKEPPPPPPLPIPDHWTAAPTIALWPGAAPGAESFRRATPASWPEAFRRGIEMPELRVFRPATANGQAILVIPGGAYWFISFVNEGADLAPRLTERGYTVFVLAYRLPSEGWARRADVPLQDAQRAMRVIRAQASQYGIDARTVSTLGFSAGGHLAATLAAQHSESVYQAVDIGDAIDARPHATGLIYPVVTMQKPWTHDLSRQLLLGSTPSRALVNHRSAELQVNAHTSPLFLVHAYDDTAVPIENSLRMISAMRTARRPVEAHLLQEGGHAFGVGRPGTPSAQWIDLFCAWLARQQ
jgi:acetyl esterase/lipase